jgi:predicted hotdog family 3-hydroxylacyl-ACP dehydratase
MISGSMVDVITYIPQRAPFVMIDELIKAEGNISITVFTVQEGQALVKDGLFTEAGIVENIAQTAAAGAGYHAVEEGKSIPVGFIGSIKDLLVHELPDAGDTITTEVQFLHHIASVHVVRGRVFKMGREIASCEMKIFIQS